MCGLAARAVVAAPVTGAEVASPIVGVIERPQLADQNQATASCARNMAEIDLRLPPGAQPVVRSVVTSRLPAASDLVHLALALTGAARAAPTVRQLGAARLGAHLQRAACHLPRNTMTVAIHNPMASGMPRIRPISMSTSSTPRLSGSGG